MMNKDMMTFGGIDADEANKAPLFDNDEENKGDTGANNGSNYLHEQAEDEILGQNYGELCLSDLHFDNE